jgi:hypothetical protein
MTSFDYENVKDLPPLPEEGAHSIDEMWANVTYFLKAVVPVAQESDVRLALHPNAPAPVSRGSGQIMGSVKGRKRLIDIVLSTSNGITFDWGVTREILYAARALHRGVSRQWRSKYVRRHEGTGEAEVSSGGSAGTSESA